MGTLILTAKHHDGFCLWPSLLTDHSIERSPWKAGLGDVLGELSQSCQQAGIRLGVYLSPWDRNAPLYGTPSYNQFYLGQLEELLTRYGPIAEVWMDGAKGANAPAMAYDFEAYWALIRRLQPGAVLFSDAGPDVRWIGNEHGKAPSTCWSTIDRSKITIGNGSATQRQYLGSGDPNGQDWVAAECDVSIRPGWFYHASEDSRVKSPRELVSLYYECVGRNATLLLNLPPDRRGLIHENDVAALREFRSILDESFRANLALGARATASNVRSAHPQFDPAKTTDADTTSYWATDDGLGQASVTLELAQEQSFDRIMIQEPIWLGQRIEHFAVEAEQLGQWRQLTDGSTVGYKRLARVPATRARRVRFSFRTARSALAISNLGLFKASPRETGDPSGSLAFGKPATASNVTGPPNVYTADKAFDDNPDTRWATDDGLAPWWLEVDLEVNPAAPALIGRVMIDEPLPFHRIQQFELQAFDGQTWRTFHTGTTVGSKHQIHVQPVTAWRVRLHVLRSTRGPTIAELQLFAR
ncbi:MAG: alpha-L-fucosidase [Proteobacteria bacterium]|nr:alpha-L-fucosidase [Pseudomonadota bacterium]